MGFVEKIGRKLASRPNDVPMSSKPDGNGPVRGAVARRAPQNMDRAPQNRDRAPQNPRRAPQNLDRASQKLDRAPQKLDHHGKCQTRHGYVHLDAVKEHPATDHTSLVEPMSNPYVATGNTSTNTTEKKAQYPQRLDVPKIQPPPVKPRSKEISPPTSRLTPSPPQERRTGSNSTRPSTGPQRSHISQQQQQQQQQQQASDNSRGQPDDFRKRPNMASSLHSSRSGKQSSYNSGKNQQGNLGDQRNRIMPGNIQRPNPVSTRRMEDSAYHAGFRDAVAQLERERQGRGPMVSH